MGILPNLRVRECLHRIADCRGITGYNLAK